MISVIKLIVFIIKYCLSHLYDLFIRKNFSKSDLPILYQTSNYVVVNKQFDILLQVGRSKDKRPSVQIQLRYLYPELLIQHLKHEIYYLHRLDYATSGLLCLARHKQACSQGAEAFRLRKVNKFYLAIVRGIVSLDMFQINMAVGTNKKEFPPMCLEKSGHAINLKHAHTKVQVLERGYCYGYPATKVLMKLITGRRHQLRLHMNGIGHTIVGDFTYSKRRDNIPYRMFLHAFSIEIPTELECIRVQSEDPFLESDPKNEWVPLKKVYSQTTDAMKRLTDANDDEFLIIT